MRVRDWFELRFRDWLRVSDWVEFRVRDWVEFRGRIFFQASLLLEKISSSRNV